MNTSHAAAASVWQPSEVQLRILGLLQAAVWAGERTGLTDEQIIARYREQHSGGIVPSESSIRSRRAELVARGKIRRSTVDGLSSGGRVSARWVSAS
jgi:hypothetical protein